MMRSETVSQEARKALAQAERMNQDIDREWDQSKADALRAALSGAKWVNASDWDVPIARWADSCAYALAA